MKLHRKSFVMLSVACLAMALLSLHSSCGQHTGTQGTAQLQAEIDSIDFAHPVQFHHARTVQVANYPDHKELVVFSPGQADTLATYILYPRTGSRPQNIKTGAIAIPIPVQRIACLSTPQVGTLPLLGASDRLVGASNLENINSPEVRQHINEGKVLEIARGMSENKESVLACSPEVVLQDFSRMDEQDVELMKVGIMPVLFNSWKEQDLLGRAEWLKVSGMLLGLNQRADSIFSRIAHDYEEARQIATNTQDTIPILYGLDYKGMWYIPGEYSYPTAMFRDAGLKYDYIPGEANSTPVSFEYVFSRHRHAKIWISVMTGKIYTKQDFTALNERYTYFDAAKEGGKIFLDRKRVNEFGGNDYWESGPYRPDLILKDLIKMTRPELLPDYELYYFIELK
ncbi:MAG: ABC transporter substrate-binding protein [Porphyromonadaceae bacterium]|nr:ABC transporter substrate-binding protein [Porphyromonadaceae bacterium]